MALMAEWVVRFVDSATDAQCTEHVEAVDRAAVEALAREQLRFRWADDDHEELPDDPTWRVEFILESEDPRAIATFAADNRGQIREPPPSEPAGERRPGPAPPAGAESAKVWNEHLARSGLGIPREPAVSDRELDEHLRRRRTDAEGDLLRNLRDEQIMPTREWAPVEGVHRGAQRPQSAVRISSESAAERVRYVDIRGDVRAIDEWLNRDGRLDDFRRAMRRGRPRRDRAQVRDELAGKVEELLAMNANIKAIAEVLHCGREAVSKLAARTPGSAQAPVP
jgi:hypothetical protein